MAAIPSHALPSGRCRRRRRRPMVVVLGLAATATALTTTPPNLALARTTRVARVGVLSPATTRLGACGGAVATAAELEALVPPELDLYLAHPDMLAKVVAEARCDSATAEYTRLKFEPRPYSAAEPRGVPASYERYLDDDRYIVVNVPPVVMFKAKCFKPSKLCAVYELHGGRRSAEVAYRPASTVGEDARGSPIGAAGFDLGTDDEFEGQIV
mmetsp:Transcript_10319/g.41758  ORF Transcript_10319/g.41758 Transcript_10319/m.41758 type:complete len:213 (-) Transcript_10319:1855-2493(-)